MRKDLTDMVFGKLTVIKFDHQKKSDYSLYWLCRCECGNEKIINGHSMKTGMQKSCGCERNKTQFVRKHGLSNTYEYLCWIGIKARIKNADGNHSQYVLKGITMDEEWQISFEAFLSHIGNAPTRKHTVDRIDNSGNYEPGNVRWATRKEQNRNLDKNVILEYNGEKKCAAEWSEIFGFKENLIYNRLKAEWPVEKILSTPVRIRKYK